MAKKIIKYDVAIKSTKQTWQMDVPKVYTNDLNSVVFQFVVSDLTTEELSTATATTLIYMKDGSFFQNPSTDVSKVGTTFSYTLKENEGNHDGIAQIQLVVTIPAVAPDLPTVYASQLYEFEVVSGLETKVAQEVMIYDWTTLTRDAQAYIDKFNLNEATRQQQFADAQTQRNTYFGAAQTQRTTDFNTAEQNRTTAFNAAESARAEGYTADHGRAETDHTTAAADHTTAGSDHTTAAADHTLAASDHTTALADHSIVQGYNTRLTTVEMNKANKVQENWITPTLLNGWITGDHGNFAPIQYKKDNFGFVHLRGGIANGVDRNICTLPVGYRPKGSVPIIAKKQWSHSLFDWLNLAENGTLTISNTVMPTDTRIYFYAIFLAEN